MSGIGAVVKVVDSHLCGWGSIPGKICIFLIVSLSKTLPLCFMCSDQHVKYRMPSGFSVTSSLLLDCHVKQYIHTYKKPIHTKNTSVLEPKCGASLPLLNSTSLQSNYCKPKKCRRKIYACKSPKVAIRVQTLG